MTTHKDHQVGQRRKLINQIGDLTDTRDQEIRKKKLSASQVWTVYEELTGNDRNVIKGRGWAVKKILKELDALEYKSYSNNVRISVDGLKTIVKALKEDEQ